MGNEEKQPRKKYLCSYCNYSSNFMFNVKAHERTHTGEKPFTCKVCNKAFSLRPSLVIHEKRSHSDYRKKKKNFTFICKTCGTSYPDRISLLNHEKYHIDGKSFICKFRYCNKAFDKQDSLSEHEKSHTAKKYACNNCDKSFERPSDLALHERSHTKERPFACNYCGKAFSKKSNMVVHEKLHTKKKNGSTDKDIREKLSHDKDSNRKVPKINQAFSSPFSCKYCTKSFVLKHHLVQHERVHTGERPFPCQICNMAFKMKQHLRKHEKIHIRDDLQSSKMVEISTKEKNLDIQDICHETKIASNIDQKVQNLPDNEHPPNNTKTNEITMKEEQEIETENKDHPPSNENNIFTCDVCHEVFDEKVDLFMHKDLNHFTCDVCHEVFDEEVVLFMHKDLNHS